MEQVIKNNFEVLKPFLEKIDFNFYSNNEDLKEVEVKVKAEDDIFKKLHDAGLEYVTTKYERNFLYDFKEQTLKKEHAICRVRRERNLNDGTQNILLTLKKKIENNDNFKEQLELESKVKDEDLEKLDDALNSSDMHPVFVYEKFRHEFSIKNFDVKVLVDVLPLIGRFVEIEGKKEEILEALKIIGIEEKDAQKSNYIELFKSNHRGNGSEYRFSEYESFLIAQKEIILISEFWHVHDNSSCSHSCSCCAHSCHSCDE